MTAGHTAPSIGSRIIAESIADGLIGSAFKAGRIQANEMIRGKLTRAVAFGAEEVLIVDMLIVPARIIAVVLAGSTSMAAFAVRGHIEGSV